MARTIGYRWHLRRLMAGKDMYATTQLRPLLAERGVGGAAARDDRAPRGGGEDRPSRREPVTAARISA